MSKINEIQGHIGHFGDGTGASSLVDEVKESRKIAQRVHAILTANGVPNSLYEDKTSKSRGANISHLVTYHNKRGGNNLIVSYHLNASGGVRNEGIGAEVLYKTQKTLSEKLSNAISVAGGFKNRGAKYRNDLGVLNGTKSAAVLLETFFVNSKADVALYQKNFEKICQAIAKVLAEHIGYKIKEATATQEVEDEFIPHRIKSGSFPSKQHAENAKLLVVRNNLASEKYITIGQNPDDKYFFQTGAYKSKEDAERALKVMQNLKILTNGHILKA